MQEFTREEVARHDHAADCWIILGNSSSNGGAKVYDVTSYLDEHPGGSEIILAFAGKDADGIFADIGHSKTAKNLIQRYEIGRIQT